MTDEKQNRINETLKFFNLLYNKIPEKNFSYLWTKQRGISFFSISNEKQSEYMALKAISLSDNGIEVWHSVNPVSVKPTDGKRGDEKTVSYQTACVVDIDIRSDAHKADQTKLAADFDEAKSFLPFQPSLIIHSGYGLHAYYIFDTPIKITDENREEIKQRNNLLIDVVRLNSAGKKIDGIGDLPRVLRTPGTFNYKLGEKNAPLCHIVEESDLLFSPAELDEKLNTLIQIQHPKSQTTTVSTKSVQNFNKNFLDDKEFNIFRTHRMLDFILPSNLTYDEWLSVGMALKNIGCTCSDWEQWSRSDDRFKDGECQKKWNGFNRDGYDIGTLSFFAQQNGYDPKEIYHEWHELQTNSSSSKKKETDDNHKTKLDSLKTELRDIVKSLADFDKEKNVALEKLRNVEIFDSDTVFTEEIVTATAFARLFDKKAFSDFKGEITNRNRKSTEKKVSVNDWLAEVRDKAEELNNRQNELTTRQTEIQTEINSLSFISNNDLLKDFSFPSEYSITNDGIVRIDGKKLVSVCRLPVIISGKYFDFEEKKYKIVLSYMNSYGKWKNLPATSAAIVANKNKLVDLAENGLPVTSSNATALVDYLDAFNAENENNFPIIYTLPRCGWYNFDGNDFFVDPRLNLSVTDEDKNISLSVDSQSQFATSLRQVGSFKNWKKAYELAKKSPIARLTVAASVAAPLLKILGERNFLLYIYAPTRAGKTTALYLGASAVGSEKIIRSFDATKNGLAGAAADVNDYPFLVDEKQVADQRLKDTFDSLVYSLANGIGRTKLNKDSSLKKTQDWRTIAIMTGETQLLRDNVTGGANTRLLSIKASKKILDTDTCKDIRDIVKENYGHAFPLIINKIFELGVKNLREWYRKIVDDFTKNYTDLLNDYCRYMAILTLADGLLNSVLGVKNALADAIFAAKDIFPLIPTTSEISDTENEKNFVLSIIAQNQSRFIGGNIPLDRMQSIWGKLDGDDYIYITVKALQDACNAEGYDYRKLVDDLISDNFFIPADIIEKGRKTPRPCVKQRIGQMSGVWCYRIRKENV